MPTEGPRLRAALVGAGLVGQAEHAFHLWEERERFELAAVVDASATVRQAVAERYGAPEQGATLADVDAERLDAVVVAVPDALHRDVVVDALDRGLHVLCEKPLALSAAECDDIADARDRSGRVMQVGYMKRHDPSVLRLLQLLPEDPAELRLVTVEVNDPDQHPFVGHLPMVEGRDVSAELIADARERTRARIAEALGSDPSRQAWRAFEAYLSSMVHDVSLLHGILEHLGEPFPERAADAAAWDEGRGVSLGAALRHGARATLVHQNLPGVADYTERVTVYCTDRILELVFPSPYLRHHPTRLTVKRSDGVTGLETTEHRPSYEESFRDELRAFHAAITAGGPVVTTVESARADIVLLLDAFRLSQERAAAALDTAAAE
jgi:predicted dehydrogenase